MWAKAQDTWQEAMFNKTYCKEATVYRNDPQC